MKATKIITIALLINILGFCHAPGLLLLSFPTITWIVGSHYINERYK